MRFPKDQVCTGFVIWNGMSANFVISVLFWAFWPQWACEVQNAISGWKTWKYQLRASFIRKMRPRGFDIWTRNVKMWAIQLSHSHFPSSRSGYFYSLASFGENEISFFLKTTWKFIVYRSKKLYLICKCSIFHSFVIVGRDQLIHVHLKILSRSLFLVT